MNSIGFLNNMVNELTRQKMRTAALKRIKKYPWTNQGGWNKGTKGIIKANSGTFKKGIIPKNSNIFISRGIKFKGTILEYKRLHHKITKLLGRPMECSRCGTTKFKKYDWANVSGDYLEVKNDWIRLCKKCHYLFDQGDKRKAKYNL